MELGDFGDSQRKLIDTATGFSLEELAKMPDEMCERFERIQRNRRDFRSAIDDFFTVVLLTDELGHEEDWIRLKMLRYVQLLCGRQLHIARYGTDNELDGLHTGLSEEELKIAKYLRSTRCERSASDECRDNFYSFPNAPPAAHKELFRQIIDLIRQKGKE